MLTGQKARPSAPVPGEVRPGSQQVATRPEVPPRGVKMALPDDNGEAEIK